MVDATDRLGAIGRDADLLRLAARLARARLVTVVAPGGMGKSTLVRAYVAEHRAAGGEAWCVDLVGVTTDAAIGPAVARGLGLEVAGEDASATVRDYLSTRTGLLLLDTLEDIHGAGRWIEGLLDAAPGIRTLAASRRPLGTPSEHELALGGLGVPRDETPDAVAASPAGALFLRHARRIAPLDLDAREAAAVAELVRRLDGLPLAIELAAGRTRLLPPSEILARLDDPALLARTSASGGDDRHESLAAVLDWSLSLLDRPQSTVLAALSACPTSADVGLAEALAPGTAAVAALDALLAAGLLARLPGAPARFRPFDTVRSRVGHGMSPAAVDAVMGRLAAHAAELADTLGSDLWDAGRQQGAVTALDSQRETIEAGVAWAVVHDPDLALRMITALTRMWVVGSDLATPIGWLRQSLDRATPGHPSRPLALALLARLLARHVGGDAVLAISDEVLAAAERDGSPMVRRLAYGAIAHAENARGNLEASGRWSIQTATVVDDPDVAAGFEETGLASLARARGEHAAALRHQRASVDAYRRCNDSLNAAISLIYVSLLELRLGRPATAAASAAESVRLNPRGYLAAGAMCMLAMAEAETAGAGDALATISRAWRLVERGPLVDRVDVLEASIPALVDVGESALAVTALAAADAIRPATGWSRAPELEWILGRAARRARRRLGSVAARVAAADAAGQRVEPLMARILALPPVTGPAPGATRIPDDLTPREVEVLALLAIGHSDGEIALALAMSPKTVSVHVGRAKEKLGATSRVDLALRAHALGIADAGRASAVDP